VVLIWGPWLFDKLWFWSLDKRLEGYEPQIISSDHEPAKLLDIKESDTKTTIIGVILRAIYMVVVWFGSVLWIGGIGCLLGIFLAVMFGHKEIFIGVCVCFGTIIGGIFPFILHYRDQGAKSKEAAYHVKRHNLKFRPKESINTKLDLGRGVIK
jgi:hypothetical protein